MSRSAMHLARDRRLWLLLAVALAIRLALAPLPDPFEADLSTFWRPWMAFGAQHGLVQLYLHGQPAVNYPPLYLALLSGLGALYHSVSPQMAPSPLQSALIKLPAIAADLAVTVMLYAAALRMVGEVDKGKGSQGSREDRRRSNAASPPLSHLVSPGSLPLLVAALWALNPAVIYVSAYWGQVDSIQTMWMLAALLAALAGRWGWSGVLLALGVLTKLQAVVIAPLLAVLAWRAGRPALLRGVLGGVAAAALGLAPLVAAGAGPAVLSVYRGSVGFYRNLTLGAYNLWWPPYWLGQRLLGRKLTDDLPVLGPVTAQWIGLAMFAAYTAMVLWAVGSRPSSRAQGNASRGVDVGRPPWQRREVVYFAAGLLVFAFFMLPTEMHERYILPALAFLALVAWLDRSLLVAYLLLSASVLLNLLEVLPFAPWLFRLLTSIPGERLALALLNLALFGWLSYRFVALARRSPGVDAAAGDGEAELIAEPAASTGAP